ncbi:hypothetical protein HU200_061582 [Digitaria exilis]|uniref:Uncharacterized protein n=1 Tax=Digitaria exilis TaxID=1010633 RepID=A0A835DZ23_9POAL|nr:hypothetical protein HU200_061582 [Digitaria exilis]
MMRSVSGSNSSRGIAAVVGVGPRLGSAVARKFASEGYTIAILSRDLGTSQKLSQLAEEIAQEAKAQVFALRVDCADARSVREAFEGVLSLGPVEVLVYNAGEPPAAADDAAAARPTPFLSVTPDAFHRSLAVSAAGAFHCAQQVRRRLCPFRFIEPIVTSPSTNHAYGWHWQVIPGMVERGRGTIIFTGSSASLTGFAGYSDLSKLALLFRLAVATPHDRNKPVASAANRFLERVRAGCGKFALRGLSQSLAREFQPAGVHIAHVIIDGVIGERRSVLRT